MGAKYQQPRFFIALAKRVSDAEDIPAETKNLFIAGASSLDEIDCTRAIESLKLLPTHVHESMRTAATRDVGEEQRMNSFLESLVGSSLDVPPDATRH